MPDEITSRDAAKLLDVSESTVRRLCAASQTTGDPIGRKPGHDWLLTAADVRALKNRPRRGKYARKKSRTRR